jgi:hypothetical protein
VLPCRPDGRTSAASNFHIKALRVRTKVMVVRMLNQMHAISISDARAPEPWWLASKRLDFECDTCLINERVRTRIHVVWTVAAIFPYLCFGRKSWSFGRTLKVVQTGCGNVRTDASWNNSKLRDIEEGQDENPRRSDGWCFGQLDVQTVWHVV